MRHKRKQIIIVGDRVLIQPDTGEKKSAAGRYLPPNVIEKQDSIKLQELGIGIGKLFGCGIFLPHKSIAPVAVSKSNE